MRFRLNITSTEEDYKAFLLFDQMKSPRGKKNVRQACLIRLLFTAVYLFTCFCFWGRSPAFALLGAAMALYGLITVLFLKQILKRRINKYVKKAKKEGRPLFDPTSQMEFYEETFVEITPQIRTEQSYSTLSRICVVKDRYIFLYEQKPFSFNLPIAQIKGQLDEKEFLAFLATKCPNIEYHEL